MELNRDHFLKTFRTDVGQMENIVARALANGGDWCDLYFEYTTYKELMLRDSEVTSGGFHVDYGVGIRVLSGERTGYAYSESTDYQDMLSAAKAASVISLSSRGGDTPLSSRSGSHLSSRPGDATTLSSRPGIAKGDISPKPYYQARHPWAEASSEAFIPFLKDLEQLTRFEGYYDDAKPEFEALKKKLSHNVAKDLEYNKQAIKNIINNDLMAAYYFQRGATQNSLRHDKQMDEAMKLITDGERYAKILNPKK